MIEDPTAARIRKRESYQQFRALADFLLTRPEPDEVLYRVHGLLDRYKAFGSREASEYARESVELVVAELRGDQDGE